MSKRTATEIITASGSSSEPYAKVAVNGDRRKPEGENEMGEFEDAWEDEIESDEEAVEGGEDDLVR
ncbi:hypothetical protein OE88DRAFT_1649923 [Heliocybe sulcata]|uniref:Uncharacterized protein n=1 Tax=Heliocybe sulcata TaxID=5364 RepID=A0A5C3NFQ0_9AGAM|nr:hypothetical protein OE88DRAFT_1649923 [Heliocybe sulcata]